MFLSAPGYAISPGAAKLTFYPGAGFDTGLTVEKCSPSAPGSVLPHRLAVSIPVPAGPPWMFFVFKDYPRPAAGIVGPRFIRPAAQPFGAASSAPEAAATQPRLIPQPSGVNINCHKAKPLSRENLP